MWCSGSTFGFDPKGKGSTPFITTNFKEAFMKAIIKLDVPMSCINKKALVVANGVVEIVTCEPDGLMPEIEGQISIDDILKE